MKFRPAKEQLYVYTARATRGFGDGFAIIVLPAYLTEIGFDPFRIGIIATAALLGTAATTLAAGFLAARYDLRNLLLVTAFVMLASGDPQFRTFGAASPDCLHRHHESTGRRQSA